MKKYNGITEPKIINVKKIISEEVDENNSNDNKNRVITDIANPSIPSIKFIEFIIEIIINMVKNWANALLTSNIPNTPWKLSINSPLSTNGINIYNYVLLDSAFVGDKWCYNIVYYPRRKNEWYRGWVIC